MPIRNSAALLLAEAVCEMFPGTQIVQVQGTDTIFFADFLFSSPFEKVFLPLLEEKMRSLLPEAEEVVTMEMVPPSAAGLFQQAGQEVYLSRLPKDRRALVCISRWKKTVVLGSGPFAPFETIAFCLSETYEAGSMDGFSMVRIIGNAFFDRQELQRWKKQKHIFQPTVRLGQQLVQPTEDGAWHWLPQGELFRQQWVRLWQDLIVKENFQLVSSAHQHDLASLEAAHRQIFSCIEKKGGDTLRLAEIAYIEHGDDEIEEGMKTPSAGWIDLAVTFCPEAQVFSECISSLQFIQQIPKILSFESQLVLCSSMHNSETKFLLKTLKAAQVAYVVDDGDYDQRPRVEIRIKDGLGRFWPGPSFWVEPKKAGAKPRLPPGFHAVVRTAFGKWERMLALVLEGGQVNTHDNRK